MNIKAAFVSLNALLLATAIVAPQALAQTSEGWVFVGQQNDGLKIFIQRDSISKGTTPTFWLREDATESYNSDYLFGVRDVKATINCTNRNAGFRYTQATVYEGNGNNRQVRLREQHEIYPGSVHELLREVVCSL